jgi:hypothetical protein
MFDLLERGRVRRAVREAIVPLVGYSEARIGMNAVRMGDRHTLGFIACLATLIALDRNPRLRSTTLGHVQTDIVALLSGDDAAAIGEEIAFLHAEAEPHYLQGHHHAAAFFDTLRPVLQSFRPEDDIARTLLEDAHLLSAWENHFEAGLRSAEMQAHSL